MKRVVHFIVLLMAFGLANAQAINKRLDAAVKSLEADSQMKNGLIGLYVINQKSGEVVYAENENVGLAAASCQKVITSAAALELLGTSYRFSTELNVSGKIENGILQGNINLVGYGDPTLGSWRYDKTKEQVVLNNWISAIRQSGIQEVQGTVIGNDKNFESQTIPGGWIWDDIGNYYGAGVSALNWRENQYDINLASGSKTGDNVKVVSIVPKLYGVRLTNELTTGKPGSGDNGYIYLPPYATTGFIRGTIPPKESFFTISGSYPNPAFQLASVLTDELKKQGIAVDSSDTKLIANLKNQLIYKHLSPPLDSINYWFLKKSINLYGEALVKALGYEKKQEGSTGAGLDIIKDFWKNKGIEPTAINMADGSGLSPQNRITAAALVRVMQYARARPWFASFYNALPEINGTKMKSGVIAGARSFTGYAGNYTFAIIINNFNGASSGVIAKMYEVIDLLK